MLQNCIISLINDLNEINDYFERSKQGELFNFVINVQPFTEKIDSHLDILKSYTSEILSLPLMNEKKLSLLNLYLRELSVECFFEKTSKKLFIDKFKSVNHDLQYINQMISNNFR